MIPKSFKQIALATIGTSCVAFGVATEAQAIVFSGTLEAHGFGFNPTENGFNIDESFSYKGKDDFSAFHSPDSSGNGQVLQQNITVPTVPEDMIDFDFLEFNTSGTSKPIFSLTSIEEIIENEKYSLTGTIMDGSDTTTLIGLLTTQNMNDDASWSISLKSDDLTEVPEPSTMLGLGLVAAASAFGLKRKNS